MSLNKIRQGLRNLYGTLRNIEENMEEEWDETERDEMLFNIYFELDELLETVEEHCLPASRKRKTSRLFKYK